MLIPQKMTNEPWDCSGGFHCICCIHKINKYTKDRKCSDETATCTTKLALLLPVNSLFTGVVYFNLLIFLK